MPTAYAVFMTKPDDRTEGLLAPADLRRLVNRLSRVSLFIRIKGELVTEDHGGGRHRCYDLGGIVKVSRATICKLCDEWHSFNERKTDAGQAIGQISVKRLGYCLFIG